LGSHRNNPLVLHPVCRRCDRRVAAGPPWSPLGPAPRPASGFRCPVPVTSINGTLMSPWQHRRHFDAVVRPASTPPGGLSRLTYPDNPGAAGLRRGRARDQRRSGRLGPGISTRPVYRAARLAPPALGQGRQRPGPLTPPQGQAPPRRAEAGAPRAPAIRRMDEPLGALEAAQRFIHAARRRPLRPQRCACRPGSGPPTGFPGVSPAPRAPQSWRPVFVRDGGLFRCEPISRVSLREAAPGHAGWARVRMLVRRGGGG
jgi:hypothetical protein